MYLHDRRVHTGGMLQVMHIYCQQVMQHIAEAHLLVVTIVCCAPTLQQSCDHTTIVLPTVIDRTITRRILRCREKTVRLHFAAAT